MESSPPARRRIAALALLALAVPLAGAAPVPKGALSAVLQFVTPEGHLVLNLGGVDVTAKLADVSLDVGADTEIEALVPPGSKLRVVVVKKGAVPSVRVWRTSTESLQDILVKRGLARKSR